jgi:hypothetical protein
MTPFRLATLAAALAALTAVGASPASASRSDWVRLGDEIASPWPAIQKRAGNFPDFTDGLQPRSRTNGPGTRYGDSVLGLALIQQGLRTHDRTLIDTGMRAIAFATRRRRAHLQRKKPSVFENYAVAAAYNLVRRRLPHHRIFVRTRSAWRAFLRRIRPVSTILRTPNTRRFGNHYLVEAIEVFELRRTGVRSANRGALAGPGLGRAVRIYRNLINRGIPRLARRKGQRRHGAATFLISDPPDYPLAYQGLAMGLYAQSIRILGRGASAAARATLRRAANASWMLTAPDGDTAYAGRSMDEAWAQSGTALGAEVAAQRRGASGAARARYRALVDATLGRLRDAYRPLPRRGYAFIPALAIDPRLGARAIEAYAGSPSFGGLALLQIEWLLDEMPARPRPTSRIAAARSFATTLSRGQSRFAVMRRGRVWFAVRAGQSITRYAHDMRYDAGLVALKSGGAGTPWRDVIPLRPLTYGPRHDSAGPVLRRGGARGRPYGTGMRIRGNTVTIFGGFRTPGGAWLRRHVRFAYSATACGVRVSWGARRGDRFEYSSFVRSFRQDPHASRASVSDSRQRVTASPLPNAARMSARRYYSASDPKLRRVRMTWRARRGGRIAVTTCAA